MDAESVAWLVDRAAEPGGRKSVAIAVKAMGLLDEDIQDLASALEADADQLIELVENQVVFFKVLEMGLVDSRAPRSLRGDAFARVLVDEDTDASVLEAKKLEVLMDLQMEDVPGKRLMALSRDLTWVVL